MGVVTIADTADRMAEDLDRRLGDMLVIVRRTGLPEIRLYEEWNKPDRAAEWKTQPGMADLPVAVFAQP